MQSYEKHFQGILCGARDEITQRGMKFTMDSLARRLRISKKTLYQAVSSRQELIERVVDSTLQSIAENEARIINDPNLSLHQQIIYAIELYRSVLKPFDKETMLEMMQSYPEQWKKIEKFRLEKWQSIIKILHFSRVEDELARINIELIMNAVLFELLMPGRLSDGESATTETLIKELTDLFRERG